LSTECSTYSSVKRTGLVYIGLPESHVTIEATRGVSRDYACSYISHVISVR